MQCLHIDRMNLLKRVRLQQITSNREIFRGFYRVHPIHFRNIHNGIISTNFAKKTNPQSIAVRPNYFIEKTINRKFSIKSWIKQRLLKSSSVISGKSMLVYAKTMDTVKHVDFLTKFNMPNSFNSWFLITEIHVWILMVRAMAENENGKAIRDSIVEAMWTDSMQRATSMAPGSASLIKKQLLILSDQFQYAIVAYDEGLATDDQQLASAIWVRFFESNCDNYEHIELLIKYIRYNVAQFDKLDTKDFLYKQNFEWPSLKDVENFN
ncbi:ubiquinol-cytochrome-c reductase complex assembly factor 1 [Contarinia nasturtii]|uniref:ubiquinol-cytochrome-c reductase complex assembly factor 1 n=1 Tax=Contarinia nasturtii TaxID=265458 RepID=UPI0012D45FBB|nr:ubiquinol-cytochrome-c reductase complex assembly factor 1 [Contarinia nasturtii]